MTQTYQNYINGQWQVSSATEVIDVINPATEAIIGQVPNSNAADVNAAVAAATAAFPAWNATPVAQRAEYFAAILAGIENDFTQLVDTIIAELGTARHFAETIQVPLALNEMRATLAEVAHYDFEEKLDEAIVIKEGMGVVACITPWNYPLNQIQRKITPALLAGNTVVVKASELTPITAILFADIIARAGLPAGVFNLVNGTGAVTGEALTSHPDVNMISFTGSTKVGKSLYAKAATTVKRLVLELGGKSALIYLPGGDLQLAVQKAADTVLNNQGQTCAALTRLVVPRAELAAVNQALIDYYADVIVGDPNHAATKVGPLVSAKQKQTVLNYIQAGKDQGAEVLIGGKDILGQGYYVEPTVFTNAGNQLTIAQEEIFGPVLTVIPYDTVEEAIAIANDTTYGLSGAVVGPPAEAEQVGRQLRTGNVYINAGARNPRAPFGGYKQSGLGREIGIYGVEDYLEIKTLFK